MKKLFWCFLSIDLHFLAWQLTTHRSNSIFSCQFYLKYNFQLLCRIWISISSNTRKRKEMRAKSQARRKYQFKVDDSSLHFSSSSPGIRLKISRDKFVVCLFLLSPASQSQAAKHHRPTWRDDVDGKCTFFHNINSRAQQNGGGVKEIEWNFYFPHNCILSKQAVKRGERLKLKKLNPKTRPAGQVSCLSSLPLFPRLFQHFFNSDGKS